MKPLHILLLAWEYPPMLVGGLGRHVYELSKSMARSGHIVHVIATHVEGARMYEYTDDVHVHRVRSEHENKEEFSKWISGLNEAMTGYGHELCNHISFDVIHAHDWLVCTAAKVLKKQHGIPLVATIHATEHGRNNGIHTSLQWEIHMKEKELVREANALIVCSKFMKAEVEDVLEAERKKLFVFPNGIDTNFFTDCTDLHIREKYHLQGRTVIFSIGRIVSEKGFHIIIEATPALLHAYPHLKFIIAGKGPMLEHFQHLTAERGLQQYVSFLGHISEEEQRAFLQESDIILVPSLYEPFGIVALEGMLANKPTIVSDVGGLSEIVIHGQNGFKIQPGNANSLAEQIMFILEDEYAQTVARNGRNYVLQHYNWNTIAQNTIEVYETTIHCSRSGG